MNLDTPHEFDLEDQPPSVLDLFNAIVSTATQDPTAWLDLNRQLHVRILGLEREDPDRPGTNRTIPAIHWWRIDRTARRGATRSTQVVTPIPAWLWALLDQPLTTPDSIRAEGRRMGIVYPPKVLGT